MKILVVKFEVTLFIVRDMRDLVEELTSIHNYLSSYQEETMDLLKYGTISRKDVFSL